ncbi:MAG: histidine phosphatase family protein [Oscillospiraceae bacterium]|nr:histidine phosphatase family protein [Oscillospiraceae bacterium]
MKLRLIRHGLTALGEAGKYQGRLDDGLCETGRVQLRRAEGVPEHVYVSPARRAKETAAILFPEARQIEVPELREMDFGVFEGRSWREMEHDAQYRAWIDGNCEGRCPGGEDRAGFSARVCAAVRRILETEAEAGSEEAVIVAHGGTQMAALGRWGTPRQEYYRWQTGCGCGWLLEWNPAEETLQILEQIGFLA